MSDKKIVWEGDSLKTLKTFPDSIKHDFGLELRKLQQSYNPLDSKPMKSIAKGVFELRQMDKSGWYRLIYFVKMKNSIYVLHCFQKKSNKTKESDLSLARTRLTNLKLRMQEKGKL